VAVPRGPPCGKRYTQDGQAAGPRQGRTHGLSVQRAGRRNGHRPPRVMRSAAHSCQDLLQPYRLETKCLASAYGLQRAHWSIGRQAGVPTKKAGGSDPSSTVASRSSPASTEWREHDGPLPKIKRMATPLLYVVGIPNRSTCRSDSSLRPCARVYMVATRPINTLL
jgi:hypothetical protein